MVLSSGGARGTAHIGVIRELINQGFEISSISGTSMGALVGGVYASGGLDEYESWLCSLSKMDVFNLVDFTLSTKGIIKADRVLKEMQKFIPDQRIEDLPVKYTAVATDLILGKEVVINSGSMYDAIRASISIPMVITPVQKNETLFVDGGVLNPLPVNRVFRHHGDILIASNVNAQIPFDKPMIEDSELGYFNKLTSRKLRGFQNKLTRLVPVNKKGSIGYFDLVSKTTGLMLSQISILTLEMNPPDLLIEVSRHSCGVFDFYKASELIELGKEAVIESIRSLN